MAVKKFNIFKNDDKAVIDGIKAICTKLGIIDKINVTITFGDGAQQLSLPSVGELKKNEVLQKLLLLSKSLIEKITINTTEQPRSIEKFTFSRENLSYDIFEVTWKNDCPVDKTIEILDAIQSAFTLYDPTQDLDKRLGPELADFYRRREQGLLRLENLTQKLIEQNEAYRRKIDDEFFAKETSLKDRTEVLENNLRSDYAKKVGALDLREKELDDRKNTHARRQLRNDIKKELKNRSEAFNLTKTTIRKRWPNHFLFTLLIAALLGILYVTITSDVGATIYHYIRLTFLGISLVVTVIFYIHWNDRWAQSHADEEFRLKRLDLDIDRASWIVEMAMEWQAENKNELPKDLLDKLSCNLFSGNESAGITEHPYEEIIKRLLNVSAEAKIPIPGGGELRLDKSGLKDLARS